MSSFKSNVIKFTKFIYGKLFLFPYNASFPINHQSLDIIKFIFKIMDYLLIQIEINSIQGVLVQQVAPG